MFVQNVRHFIPFKLKLRLCRQMLVIGTECPEHPSAGWDADLGSQTENCHLHISHSFLLCKEGLVMWPISVRTLQGSTSLVSPHRLLASDFPLLITAKWSRMRWQGRYEYCKRRCVQNFSQKRSNYLRNFCARRQYWNRPNRKERSCLVLGEM
jgi:hypothetical protein